MSPRTVRIGDARVTLFPGLRHIVHEFLVNELPTVTLDARYPPNAAEAATAVRLGYGWDTWTMQVDHELGHHWLAVHLDGYAWSPTIHAVALEAEAERLTAKGVDLVNGWPIGLHRPELDREARDREEDRVLGLQVGLNLRGVRPWNDNNPGAMP